MRPSRAVPIIAARGRYGMGKRGRGYGPGRHQASGQEAAETADGADTVTTSTGKSARAAVPGTRMRAHGRLLRYAWELLTRDDCRSCLGGQAIRGSAYVHRSPVHGPETGREGTLIVEGLVDPL